MSCLRHTWALLTLVTLGCAELPVEGEVVVRGASAQVMRRVDSPEAGLTWVVTIDSATATWHSACNSQLDQVPCPARWKNSGAVSPGQLEQLFRRANSDAVRALRAQYDLSATYVDAPLYELIITANSRRRTIRWADLTTVPAALLAFDDLVLLSANMPTPDRAGR